jgi:hypothetical protein
MKLQLYKPVVSSRKEKKYMVLTKNGIVHFGARGMGQFRDKLGHYSHLDHNDKKRRENYYKRHGERNLKDKERAKYWSHTILW